MPSPDGEPLPPMRVNGVLLQVTRVEDVARRLPLIEAEWRKAGDVSSWREAGEWRVLTRRQGRWSETLQVREAGSGSEAYLSRLDLQQRPGPTPRLPLPSGCRANSVVESMEARLRVVQTSGPCRPKSGVEASAWASQLLSQGWSSGPLASDRVWQFRRGADVLQIVRAPTWFTALQTSTRRGAP